MRFEFSVVRAGRIPSAGIIYLDGRLDSGTILNGAVASLKGKIGRKVTIKSVALVNSEEIDRTRLTLSIDEPGFPLSELEGSTLLGEN